MRRDIYFSFDGNDIVRGFMFLEFDAAPSAIQAMMKSVKFFQECGHDSGLYETKGFGRYYCRGENGYYTCEEYEEENAVEDSTYNIIEEWNDIRFIFKEWDLEEGEDYPDAPPIIYENWECGDLVIKKERLGELIEFCDSWDKPFIFKHEGMMYDLQY